MAGINRSSPIELFTNDNLSEVILKGGFSYFAGMSVVSNSRKNAANDFQFECTLEASKFTYSENYHGLGSQYSTHVVSEIVKLGLAFYPVKIRAGEHFHVWPGFSVNTLLYSYAHSSTSNQDILSGVVNVTETNGRNKELSKVVPALLLQNCKSFSIKKQIQGELFYRLDVPFATEISRERIYVIFNNLGIKFRL